jgi:hypothetical protein
VLLQVPVKGHDYKQDRSNGNSKKHSYTPLMAVIPPLGLVPLHQGQQGGEEEDDGSLGDATQSVVSASLDRLKDIAKEVTALDAAARAAASSSAASGGGDAHAAAARADISTRTSMEWAQINSVIRTHLAAIRPEQQISFLESIGAMVCTRVVHVCMYVGVCVCV